jgi:hypothetical protein
MLYHFVVDGDENATDGTRSFGFLESVNVGMTRIYLYEFIRSTPGGNAICFIELPDEQLVGRILLSFSVAVTPISSPDSIHVDMAIYKDGVRLATLERRGEPYAPLAGNMTLGRRLLSDQTGAFYPFFGTMYSVSIDDQPLDYTVESYDNWETCTGATVRTVVANTTTTGGNVGGPSSATSTSLVLTGRDLDGGGAVGLDEEESAGTQGSGLPLTLILVLAALVVVCALSLGALLVWRSRRRGRTVTTAKATATADPSLPRSRSSRRRRGDGNYTKIGAVAPDDEYTNVPSLTMTEYSPMPDGSTEPEYTTMPTAAAEGESGESGYRAVPAGQDYGTMPPVRTHAYGGVEGQVAATPTYTEFSRPNDVPAGQSTYSTGDLTVHG